MKRRQILKASWSVPVISSINLPANAQTSAMCMDASSPASFNSPGTYTFIVPPGVTQIMAEVLGAGGATSLRATPDMGMPGTGGLSQGSITVTPCEELTVIVGAAGQGTTGGSGYGRGGDGNGPGGGGSAILRGTTPLIVAGGGGGGGTLIGDTGIGGDGGGSSGGSSIDNVNHTSSFTVQGGSNGNGGTTILADPLPGPGLVEQGEDGGATDGGAGGFSATFDDISAGGGGGYGGGAGGAWESGGGGGGGLAPAGGSTVTGGGSTGDGSITISW